MTSKKGFEIGVNLIVVMILAIVILGSGFVIFSSLFEKAEGLNQNVDQATRQRIDALLDKGDPVSIPRNSATLELGEEGLFHIGINNELTTEKFFEVAIDQVSFSITDFEVIYDNTQFSIEPGQRKYMPFKIVAPGEVDKGTYIFDVNVCFQSDDPNAVVDCSGSLPNRYYLLQKIYINVR